MSSLDPAILAQRLGLPFWERIDEERLDPALLARLPLAFARSHAILPIAQQDGALLTATADPTDLPALDEVRALLLVTEIRLRAEQKGLASVETEGNRLKLLRASGRRDDWVMLGTRFPRLTAPKPLLRLREIVTFIPHLS